MVSTPATESTPTQSEAPGPEKYSLLLDTIQTYKTENAKLTDEQILTTRVNEYKKEDTSFTVFTYKIMTVVYALIYIVFCWALFAYREKVGISTAIVLAIVFALYPFSINYIASYMYDTFIKLMHYFNKGNAVFLYKPPEKTPLY